MNTNVATDIYNRMVTCINDKIGYTTIKNIDFTKVEQINNDMLWIQLLLYDEDVLPIKVDLLTSILSIPTKNIYILPGTGLNVESNFILPTNNSLATFLANKSYLVIGITPREDVAPQDFNFELMRDWGIQKHTDDVNKVIKLFQSMYNMRYELLGHSAGASVTFNYASKIGSQNKKFKAIRIIDTIGQYPPNSDKYNNAQISMNACNQLINTGIFVNTETAGIKFLIQQAQIDPNGDSGVPRPVPGGNFTNVGLLHFSLIFTAQLPGVLTEITGLPGSWYLEQGFLAGTYDFGDIPTNDVFTLTHTNINTIYTSIPMIGSGIYPLAYERDIYAMLSNSFPITWSNIKVSVYYVNAELGTGNPGYTVGLLAGTSVYSSMVQNYGHADCVYSNTAKTDFWNILVP